MWATKIFLCRSPVFYPTLAKVTQPAPKTFSTLNCLTQQILKNRNASQCYKLFYKPTKRVDVPIRKVVAIPARRTSLSPQKQVGMWLLLCAGMVYGAITLGGYTRLTESGLSMVNWRFTFEMFPSTEEEWIAEFEKYKEYPEFKQLKRDLTLEEFQGIWYNEYRHRNWGRFLGFIFLFPATLFWYKGYFLPDMKKKIGVFAGLIAAQGLLGWYMVKSGLEDRFHKETDIPRVSQYRLAAHLGMALVLYMSFLRTSLELLVPARTIPGATAGARRLKMLAHASKGMVFLTALSGAFVAGLDAGLVYNSFPKMADKWIPDDILALSPVLKNFTENPTTVQFDHRILGISTFSLIMATWILGRKQNLPTRARYLLNGFAVLACFQVLMGVSTLVHHVPISQAMGHQSGSVMLLTAAVWLSHELKKLKHLPK